MKISAQAEDFDLTREMDLIRKDRQDIGALVSFTGLVRDMHNDRKVKKMTLEHYPAMANKELGKIAEIAQDRWPLQDITVIHRYGELMPGDQIVLVITASAHRQAAFDAAAFIMDWLKTDAPFWKKEQTEEGEHWVGAQTRDQRAHDKWT